MKSNFLYHLTSKENLEAIMKEGLTPKIGDNSKIAGDHVPSIYLSYKIDLPYWQILLGSSAVVRVNMEGIDFSKNICHYTNYREIVLESAIESNRISIVEMTPVRKMYMINLCIGFMYNINKVTECFANYYNNLRTDTITSDFIDKELNFLINILKRLDYTCLPKNRIIRELQYMGNECMYTFVDFYCNTGNKLYQQLLLYPEDEFSDRRKWLYDYITKAFDGCLYVNTGGWTT